MNQMNENDIADDEQNFPKGFLQLYSALKIETAGDGLTLLLHAILLEVGFIPNDVAAHDVYRCMPKNWNSSGIFKIQYYHKNVPEALCWVTCVPMYKNLTIQGTFIDEVLEDDNVHMKLLIDSYVVDKRDVADPSKLFIHVKELSRTFKDQFCFALLVPAQESVNYKPAFGLNGLVDDVKISILKSLPVEDVISLSIVNKHFHRQANSLDLWKFMYLRDYGSDESAFNSDVEENWKDMYKAEYLKRKRLREFRPPMPVFPSHYLPQIYPVCPNFNYDPRIDMDPALQRAFPEMRNRFRRSDWPFRPWNGGFNFFGRF